MASMSISIGKALPKPFGSEPGSGFASAAALTIKDDFLEDLLEVLRTEETTRAVVGVNIDAERADMMTK